MSTPGRLSTADLARVEEPAAPPETAQPRAAAASVPLDEGSFSPLFAEDAAADLRRQWDTIQSGFVDEPRRAVEEADSLVADTMKRLADTFAQERSTLEQQWGRGDDVSTEDLRVALRRYRSFFKRLLSV
jgi:hypothetical protein